MKTLRTYTLRVMGEDEGFDEAERADALERVLPPALSEAEENISDLLPEGYYVKVEEWDE